MRRMKGSVLAILGALMLAIPVLAHHSFTAEFDVLKPATISGTITKTEWINPHIHMFIDVKDEKGNIVPWDIETWGTLNAHRGGLTREKIAPGTPVKVLAYRAKDGTKNFAYMRTIWLPDGSELELWVGGADGSPGQQGNQ
jgi:hypothetical protein